MEQDDVLEEGIKKEQTPREETAPAGDEPVFICESRKPIRKRRFRKQRATSTEVMRDTENPPFSARTTEEQTPAPADDEPVFICESRKPIRKRRFIQRPTSVDDEVVLLHDSKNPPVTAQSSREQNASSADDDPVILCERRKSSRLAKRNRSDEQAVANDLPDMANPGDQEELIRKLRNASIEDRVGILRTDSATGSRNSHSVVKEECNSNGRNSSNEDAVNFFNALDMPDVETRSREQTVSSADDDPVILCERRKSSRSAKRKTDSTNVHSTAKKRCNRRDGAEADDDRVAVNHALGIVTEEPRTDSATGSRNSHSVVKEECNSNGRNSSNEDAVNFFNALDMPDVETSFHGFSDSDDGVFNALLYMVGEPRSAEEGGVAAIPATSSSGSASDLRYHSPPNDVAEPGRSDEEDDSDNESRGIVIDLDANMSQTGTSMSQTDTSMSQTDTSMSQMDTSISEIHASMSEMEACMSQIRASMSEIEASMSRMSALINTSMSHIDASMSRMGASMSLMGAGMSRMYAGMTSFRNRMAHYLEDTRNRVPDEDSGVDVEGGGGEAPASTSNKGETSAQQSASPAEEVEEEEGELSLINAAIDVLCATTGMPRPAAEDDDDDDYVSESELRLHDSASHDAAISPVPSVSSSSRPEVTASQLDPVRFYPRNRWLEQWDDFLRNHNADEADETPASGPGDDDWQVQPVHVILRNIVGNHIGVSMSDRNEDPVAEDTSTDDEEEEEEVEVTSEDITYNSVRVLHALEHNRAMLESSNDSSPSARTTVPPAQSVASRTRSRMVYSLDDERSILLLDLPNDSSPSARNAEPPVQSVASRTRSGRIREERENARAIRNHISEYLARIGNQLGVWNMFERALDEEPARLRRSQESIRTAGLFIAQEQVDEGLNCLICLEDFCLEENAYRIACNHMFHKHCMDRWLQCRSSCPACRSNIRGPDSKPN